MNRNGSSPLFKLAVVLSHPIQYYSPLFRELSQRVDLHVYYTQTATPAQLAAAGFGVEYQWDLDLLEGYRYSFLENVARRPSLSSFAGADTPSIGRRLAEGGFDAVLVPGWRYKAYLQTLWAAKTLGIPVLVRGDSQLGTPRGFLKRSAKFMFWPLLLKCYSAVLYVGEHSRRYYAHYGYPCNKMYHSPHAIDNDRFEAHSGALAREKMREGLNIRSVEKVVLFVGKLIDMKRPLDAVEIVAQARRKISSLSLLIAGSGPLDSLVAARARELAVPVRFLGFQNQTQLPAVYAAADALLLPSDSRETWGLVCNEAIACGVPLVLSSEVGAAPDLITRSKAGSTYMVGNIFEGAEALCRVLTAPPSRQTLKAASEDYSLYCAIDGIIKATQGVCGQRRRISK